MADENILSQADIAAYLKLRPETVLRKVKREEIPAIKVGGHFRFDKRQIDEWIQCRSISKKRILVIDDEEVIRLLFKDTLEDDGYHVITAQSGIEALDLMKMWNFDLIFTDLKMPEMNGADVFYQIRQINSSVPIVLITGYPTSDIMDYVLEQGPFGIMRKPFSALTIKNSVDSFLRGAEAKNTLAESLKHIGCVEG